MEKTYKNSNSAKFDKEILWLLEEKYHGEKTDAFFSDITRLEKGEPVDYVIGFTQFLGCHIDLSHSPLIPRTETEFWVEQAIQKILKNETRQKPIHCLDLFSGSGCIAIAILQHIKTATMDLSDNKNSCLKQIQKNLVENMIEVSRVHIYKSDCLEDIPQKKYDYIFANPPYIAYGRENYVQKSVLEWEPADALFAEDDGFYYVKKIIDQSPSFLKRNGTLIIEFDSCQKEILEKKIISKKMYKSTFWKDQFGKWRVVILEKI